MNNEQFYKNNVKANNQTDKSFFFQGCDFNQAKYKILFIGNSITFHKAKPEIGWFNNCGMAASDMEHDYVHLVFEYCKSKKEDVNICIFNCSKWELDYQNNRKLDELKMLYQKYKPDLVVVRIGENFNQTYLKQNIDTDPAFDALLNICSTFNNQVIATSLFWGNDVIDKSIKKAANKYHADFVLISDISKEAKCEALNEFEHPGVRVHPSDLGMKEIAERIIKVIR